VERVFENRSMSSRARTVVLSRLLEVLVIHDSMEGDQLRGSMRRHVSKTDRTRRRDHILL
jgi:hypothetical protein